MSEATMGEDNVAIHHSRISAAVVHDAPATDVDVRHHGDDDSVIIYDYVLRPPRLPHNSNGTAGYVLHLYPCRHGD